MRIAILSYYYPPDLSAGSFRVHSLVKEFAERNLDAKTEIDVITTTPTRYIEYSKRAIICENDERGPTGVLIKRIYVPNFQLGLIGQIINFCKYAVGVGLYCSHRDYDIVFATSSRLMTAVLGVMVARNCHARLYVDIRDLFVDTISDLYRGRIGKVLEYLFSKLEVLVIRSAWKINVVSEGFLPYINKKYGQVAVSNFTNGIDSEFENLSIHSKNIKVFDEDVINILYAGNIGKGQRLEKILPDLADALGQKFIFTVIGDGGLKTELLDVINKRTLKNIKLIDPMPRSDLLNYYRKSDILFLHLDDCAAFE